jgi:3-oxoacyl-[acyl-carrier protein] reductase
MKLLANKVAIITGAAQGLGKGVALKFAEHGAKIAVCDVNFEKLQTVVSEIRSRGGEIFGMKVDVSNRSEFQAFIKEIMEKYSQIDILINNAGIIRDSMLEKMTDQLWDEVLTVNLKSMFITCQEVLKIMKAKAKSEEGDPKCNGKIVNFSSLAANGNVGQTNYCAAKAGVEGLTLALSKEYGRYKIMVNAVRPGFIRTPMMESIPEKFQLRAKSMIPLEDFGEPEDLANVVLFLSSSLSDYVSGNVIKVDGGLKP